MATYTGVADANGDFNIPFSANYTGGQKITVTAEKEGSTKSIELYAPSGVVGGGSIQFSGTLNNFPENIGVITISELTGSIKANAFRAYAGDHNIFRLAKGLNIAANATTIGDFAFYDWQNAERITINPPVTTVGAYAFAQAVKATELELPDTLTTLGSYSFAYFYLLETVNLPLSLTEVPASCFAQCRAATHLVIPSNIKSIGGDAFYDWRAATHLTIGSGVKNISGRAFGQWMACLEITVLATTPPAIQPSTFVDLNASCIFKVPAGSVAAYQAATNWSAFAARIQAI